MRIIGFNGVWSIDNPIWGNFEHAFRDHIDVTEFSVEEERDCKPWQIGRYKRYMKRAIKNFDTGGKAIAIGYSLGGSAAYAALPHFVATEIVAVVTIFAPHQFLGGIYPKLLGTHDETHIPLITFQAKRDELVRYGSRHPHSTHHSELDSDHFHDLVRNPAIAAQVAHETTTTLRKLGLEL